MDETCQNRAQSRWNTRNGANSQASECHGVRVNEQRAPLETSHVVESVCGAPRGGSASRPSSVSPNFPASILEQLLTEHKWDLAHDPEDSLARRVRVQKNVVKQRDFPKL